MSNLDQKPEELPSNTYEQIKALCAAGDQHCEAGEHELALAEFEKALSLLPTPIERWEAAIWILTAIGDTHYSMGAFENSRNALAGAMLCPGALGNPFIHLRLGQSLYELGKHEKAMDELARAYMGAGIAIFHGEPPKYLSFLRKHMKDVR